MIQKVIKESKNVICWSLTQYFMAIQEKDRLKIKKLFLTLERSVKNANKKQAFFLLIYLNSSAFQIFQR